MFNTGYKSKYIINFDLNFKQCLVDENVLLLIYVFCFSKHMCGAFVITSSENQKRHKLNQRVAMKFGLRFWPGNSLSFVCLPLQTPFPISIDVGSYFIVIQSYTDLHKNLIFFFNVDHFQGVNLAQCSLYLELPPPQQWWDNSQIQSSKWQISTRSLTMKRFFRLSWAHMWQSNVWQSIPYLGVSSLTAI